MPSLQGHLGQLFIQYYIAPKFRQVGYSIPEWRKILSQLNMYQKIPPDTHIQALNVQGVPAEWVSAPDSEIEKAVLYLHGGAFVMGSPETHRVLAALLSASSKSRILVLDYRLAPEHPFPAALQDTLAAYRWLLQEGYPANQLAIGGDSVGGGMAIQALITLRDDETPLPAAAFSMSAVADWVRFDGESYCTRAGIDPWITSEMCRFTAQKYVGDNNPETPLLYLLNLDLTGLPPLCIHVGDQEVLLSDSTRLAERARSDNVQVELKIWPGMWHVFQSSGNILPEARQSLTEMGLFILNHLAS